MLDNNNWLEYMLGMLFNRRDAASKQMESDRVVAVTTKMLCVSHCF